MSKATLSVPGVDPADIECRTDTEGVQRVKFRDRTVSFLGPEGPWFDGNWIDAKIRSDCQKVMNACIDNWRATGRLFPEPLPEPVACVCGGKAAVSQSGGDVWCANNCCQLGANNVADWNIIQAALKAKKS